MQFEFITDEAGTETEPVSPGTSSCYPGGSYNYPECCTSGDYMC